MDIRRRRDGNMMSPADITLLNTVLARVQAEVCRQHQERGPQHHPDGTSPAYAPGADIYRMLSGQFTGSYAASRPWTYAVLEEFFTAAQVEDDDVELRTHVVRLVATCAAWLMDLETRGAAASSALDAMQEAEIAEQIPLAREVGR